MRLSMARVAGVFLFLFVLVSFAVAAEKVVISFEAKEGFPPPGKDFAGKGIPRRVINMWTADEPKGSRWFVENILGPVIIIDEPASRTNAAGTVAGFDVAAGGTPPLTYQWLKDGIPLSDGATPASLPGRVPVRRGGR